MHALTQMDSILAHQRNVSKNPFTITAQPTQSRPQMRDSFPRSFQPAMDSSLPESFALWPPTPRTNGNRPAIVHETSFQQYSLPEDCSGTVPTWDPSCLIPSESHSIGASGVDMSQQYDSSLEHVWNHQPIGDYGPVSRNLDTDVVRLGSSYGSSNNSASLLDPYHYSPHSDALSLNTNVSRCLSDTASMSSGEALVSASDVPFYGDSPYEPSPYEGSPYEGSPYEGSPYEGSIMSDYTHRSGLAISNSSTPMSPLMSPHQTSHMSMRSGSRGRASPSPSRSGMGARATPYSSAERNTSKRWSTGSYIAGSQSQTSSPYTNEMNPYQLPPNLNSHSHHSSPTCSTGCPPPPQQMLLSHSNGFSNGRSSSSSNNGYAQNPYVDDHSCPPMPSHLLVKMLQSNAAEHYRSHRTDQSDPPDLYASLTEDQTPPPQEDMNPLDPDLKPHEQDLRFEGDLYTPRWVRGHGNKREGWCGICKPGRWLVLKNSAFWYDKSFTHGISAATGQRFVEPKLVRRMEGNPDVWEGLCHSCSEWVALVSNKKKGTTWFRHAYKCHTHPKIKDAPKRRRESSQGKVAAAAAAAAARVRQEVMTVVVDPQHRQLHHNHHHNHY